MEAEAVETTANTGEGASSIKAHCSKTVHRTVRAIRARTSQVTQCVGALTRVLHIHPCTAMFGRAVARNRRVQ